MNKETEIVQKITEEVLRYFSASESSETSQSTNVCCNANHDAIMVITSSYVPNAEKIAQYLKKNYRSYHLVGVKKAETSLGIANAVLDEQSQEQIAARVEKQKRLVIVAPRLYQIKNMISGQDKEPLEYVTLNALMQGKETEIVLGCRTSEHMNNALERKVLQMVDQMNRMGIDVIDNIFAEQEPNGKRKNNKSFISEEEVLLANSRNEKEVWLEKNAIITPLARDTAKELGITFQIR